MSKGFCVLCRDDSGQVSSGVRYPNQRVCRSLVRFGCADQRATGDTDPRNPRGDIPVLLCSLRRRATKSLMCVLIVHQQHVQGRYLNYRTACLADKKQVAGVAGQTHADDREAWEHYLLLYDLTVLEASIKDSEAAERSNHVAGRVADDGGGRVGAFCTQALHRIPRVARVAALIGVVLLAVLGVRAYLAGGSAVLNLVCRHNLRAADLAVYIDGKLSYTEQLSGSAKKRFGIVGPRVAKTFSKSLVVPSGERVVNVHLKSAADGFDQEQSCSLNLPPGKAGTLVIAMQQNGMSLTFQGSPVAPAESAGSGYRDSVRWILLTVGGSAVSAGIGFMVQEFLRSRKAI